MDTSLAIDTQEARSLASALAALTGQSVTATILSALQESLEREQRDSQARGAATLGRAIAANLRQEGRHLSSVPTYGWCKTAGDQPR